MLRAGKVSSFRKDEHEDSHNMENEFRNHQQPSSSTRERRLGVLLSHLQLIASPFVRHSANVVQYFSQINNDSENNKTSQQPPPNISTNNNQNQNKKENRQSIQPPKHHHSDNTLLQNLFSKSSSSKSKVISMENNQPPRMDDQAFNQMADASTRSRTSGADVLLQFSPLVSGQIKQAQVTYISPHSASESADSTSMQAGVLLVASTRADLRRAFIERLCQAAVERSALVYSIATQGGVNVSTDGVYKLSTHPTLSRRAILNALLRHGAHLLVFGTISTRDDVMSLMDAAYTGYHCVAEIYGESAHDVLSRLEAIGVDVSMLPQNLRIVVPANTTSSLT